MSQSCCERKRADKSALSTKHAIEFRRGICPAPRYFPAKISQSPCDAAMNKSIGSESQALVREATKA